MNATKLMSCSQILYTVPLFSRKYMMSFKTDVYALRGNKNPLVKKETCGTEAPPGFNSWCSYPEMKGETLLSQWTETID